MTTPGSQLLFVAVLLAAALVLVAPGMAAAAVPGLVRVSKPSDYDTAGVKNVMVSCPAGKRVVSPGADIIGGSGRVLLDDIVIYSPTQVSVSAVRHLGEPTPWALTAYAVCADPLPGLTYVSRITDATPAAKSRTASCPAGTRVVGAGADLWDANGEALIGAIVPGETSVTVTARNTATAKLPLSSWRLRAHAVCADPLPGLVVDSVYSGYGAFTERLMWISCVGGRRLIGAGAEIVDPYGVAVIDNILPRPALDGVEVTGRSILSGGSWFGVRAYRICATP